MSILRRREAAWSAIPVAMLASPSLSWEAKGLLAFLLSKPDGWEIRTSHLVSIGPAGEDKVLRVLDELERVGYIARYREQKDGKFQWVTWIFFDPADNDVQAKVEADKSLYRRRPAAPHRDFPDGEIPDGEIPGSSIDLNAGKKESGVPTSGIILNLDAFANAPGSTLPATVRQAYEQAIGLIASPILNDDILVAIRDYGEEMVVAALNACAQRPVRSWAYTKGILKRMATQGAAAQTKAPKSNGKTSTPDDQAIEECMAFLHLDRLAAIEYLKTQGVSQ